MKMADKNGRRSIPWLLFIGFTLIFFFVAQEFFPLRPYVEDSARSFGKAIDEGNLARRLFSFMMLNLGAVAVALRFSRPDVLRFAVFSSACYVFLDLGLELYLGTFHPFVLEYRFSGTLHPNYQALNCSMLLVSSIAYLRYSRRSKPLLVAVAMMAVVLLFLTKSRTSFASAIVVLFVYWLLQTTARQKVGTLFAALAVACITLLFFSEKVIPLVKQGVLMGREGRFTHSLSGRVPLWKTCMAYVERRPIAGHGFGAFWTPKHITAVANRQPWAVRSAHSAYIESLLNSGVVGLLLLLTLLIYGLRYSWLYYRQSREPCYLFFTVILFFGAIHGLMESAIMQIGYLTFLVWLILYSLAVRPPAIAPAVSPPADGHTSTRDSAFENTHEQNEPKNA